MYFLRSLKNAIQIVWDIAIAILGLAVVAWLYYGAYLLATGG